MHITDNSIDPTALEKIRELQCEGEPDIVQEFIDIYLVKTPPLVENLRKAIGLSDSKRIQYLAHTIKGSSALIGAISMVKLSAMLEERSCKGLLSGSEALFEQLEAEFQHVSARFMEMLSFEQVH